MPSFFAQHLSPKDTIIALGFDNTDEQYKAVAVEIKRLLEDEELEHSDFLIILPSVYTSKSEGARILRVLLAAGLQGHIPGVTTSRDSLFIEGSIAITHIFRAKGNEAPVVFLVNADFCESPIAIKKKRNKYCTSDATTSTGRNRSASVDATSLNTCFLLSPTCNAHGHTSQA